MNTSLDIRSPELPVSDVLIVGAGPTGLSLATALTLRGVTVTVIDRQAEGANTSRAAVIHAHTLELLERIGVARHLEDLGLKCGVFSIHDRDRNLMSIDFTNLPTEYPYTLMLSQAVTESVLLSRLQELGGKVYRPCVLTGLHQDEDGVEAQLEDGTRLRARYLVGADGMHSKVRESAGIPFVGDSYGQSFILADVRLSGGVPSDQVILYFSPAGLVVAAPLPGGTHRIVATVDDARETPAIEDIQKLLDSRGPDRIPATVEGMVWSSRFRVHHRIAETYRSGRVLLAGDAAHVHSPAGGQGMNTGIQDAMALAEALAGSLKAGNPQELDHYTAHRRPIAEGVIGLADRLTRLATVNRRLTSIRNFFIRLLALNGGFRYKLAMRLAGLSH